MGRPSRAIRREFPQAATEQVVAVARGLIQPPNSEKYRGREGYLTLTDMAVYAEVDLGMFRGKAYQRVALDELELADSGEPPSRFGSSDVYVVFWSPGERIVARLKTGLLSNTDPFVEAALQAGDKGRVREEAFANMVMMAWELNQIDDGPDQDDAALEMVERVCAFDPTLRLRVIESIARLEAQGRDFSEDSITDDIIRNAGYLRSRASMLKLSEGLPPSVTAVYPEMIGEPVRAVVDGILHIEGATGVAVTAYWARPGWVFDAQQGDLGGSRSFVYVPVDRIVDVSFSERDRSRAVVQLSTELERLRFNVADPSSDDVKVFDSFMNFLQSTRDHEAKIRQTPAPDLSEPLLQELEQSASSSVLSWELSRIPSSDQRARARVTTSMKMALEEHPGMLRQIAFELLALDIAGLDTADKEVQTVAFRKALYLKARGLSYLTVDARNLKRRSI